ncbi:glutathionylspermidine synthase [Fictibacillus phosphorivorans]|uniref:Glutathionylspermidine synthase n=1 Tax=Fictibacillus phosphorivorans TaxID=1221500 RepID=A0A160INN0_9BACL|nr:glutathionylspermidine synthase family protein [Fictibacillus phosphorivorans]ANC77968.1 glutathionylspermidine synthase [Fictibacillus phosphorivorans]
MTYIVNRQKFYNKLPEFWADMYGQEYALYEPAEISEDAVRDARNLGERAGHILFKTASLLQSEDIEDDTLQLLGFPSALNSFLRHQTPLAKTVIGRIDSIETPEGHKIMEFNSDTPTFIFECFKVNGLICKHHGYRDPNEEKEKQLQNAVRSSILSAYRNLQKEHAPYIVFTAHEENIEDKHTVLYLKELSGFPSEFVPLEELVIRKGIGLFDQKGKKIDVLYRQTFPIELLIQDVDKVTNEDIGLQLTELVVQNKLAVINPPSAFLLQSKAILAVIWGLHEERSPYFTSEEHEWIERYFLPTYLEPETFLKNKEKYVQKPVFGREGDTVRIFDGNGVMIDQDKHLSYDHYVSVYQKYVSLPKMTFQSVKGIQKGYRMTGTFLINGKASAFGYRIGNAITDNLSYFLPSYIKQT